MAQTSFINLIDNLRFFKSDGTEISMQKDYYFTWELIPCEMISGSFVRAPYGHFLIDKDGKITICIEECGSIIPSASFVRKQGYSDYVWSASDNRFIQITSSEKTFSIDNIEDVIFFEYAVEKNSVDKLNVYANKIRIGISSFNETAFQDYNICDIFRYRDNGKDNSFNENIEIFIGDDPSYDGTENPNTKTISTKRLDNNPTYMMLRATIKEELTNADYMDPIYRETVEIPNDPTLWNGHADIIEAIADINLPKNLYPYIKYHGSVVQDKVSSDLIAPTTIVILSNDKDTDDLIYPFYKPTNGMEQDLELSFRFESNSEFRFFHINHSSNELVWHNNNLWSTLGDDENGDYGTSHTKSEALTFNVGFITEDEGCFQNSVGMFFSEDGVEHFIGGITFHTEVEGEDERYRTLLTNFGIPDPITYPNIFRSKNPNDDGIDWNLVNEKSKELMLTYDEIFPFVGTYKALMNAIKFLGYEDLIFKEWYKIKNSTNEDRYVSIQTYDMQKRMPVEDTLKKYGVEYGEYERYTKLNRLSMIYHLQKEDDDDYEERLPGAPYAYDNELIPKIKNVYDFRTDEVIAKLFAVKNWLERHILGVNCYISDINGEGIILERLRLEGYVTGGELIDIQKRGSFTPKMADYDTVNAITEKDIDGILGASEGDSEIAIDDAHASISCTLSEFENQTFANLADYPISRFIRSKETTSLGDVYVSSPFGAMIVADELEYELHLDNTECGTLYEFMAEDSKSNPIIVSEGEIKLWDDRKKTANIDSRELPIITVKTGNIRTLDGSWNNNIKWSIKPSYDANGNVSYRVLNLEDSSYTVSKGYVCLIPDADATLSYTTNNKWGLPMFVFTNYTITNTIGCSDENADNLKTFTSSFIEKNKQFVIEIIDGEMAFKNKNQNPSEMDCNNATLYFAEPVNEEKQTEQVIGIDYVYRSDRVCPYTFDYNAFRSRSTAFTSVDDMLSHLEDYTALQTKTEVKVNRCGTYSISVKAYDAYNNIFTNRGAYKKTIYADKIGLSTIVNQEHSRNGKEFYSKQMKGTPLGFIKSLALAGTIDSNAKLPMAYKIYNAEHEDDTDNITFQNISYAVDTVKRNGFLLVSNLTEKAKHATMQGTKLAIDLWDDGIAKQTFKNKVNLCLYDDNNHVILKESENGFSFSWDGDNHIIINDAIGTDNGKINPLEIPSINADNNINLYIIDASSTSFGESDIIVDEEQRCTFIKISSDELNPFNIDTMVKIVISRSSNEIISETAYRITDIVNIEGLYHYKLNGVIDVNLLNGIHNDTNMKNTPMPIYSKEVFGVRYTDQILGASEPTYKRYAKSPLSFAMKSLNEKACVYNLRVSDDAVEYKERNEDGTSYVMKTQIPYVKERLMFDTYLDDSYAVIPFNYEPHLLNRIWSDIRCKLLLTLHGDDMYVYNDFPITIKNGQNIILKPNVNLKKGLYKVNWKWQTYVIEERRNWKDYKYENQMTTLFESTNNILSVAPTMVGPQSIQVCCMDKYGNRFYNRFGGNLYIEG